MSPLCESYVSFQQLNSMEAFYPLHVFVCEKCFLVQLEEFVKPEAIFSEYAYFSSYAESWLAHARTYTDRMISRWNLGGHHQVMEVASNDGYLLQYFVARGIPALGIEPAANVAAVAAAKGVPTRVAFFGRETARALVAEGKQADLLIGNNVLAQVPDLADFVGGMKIVLRPGGVVTLEFPHLQQLIEGNQFDTIYHEHFSYFSFLTVREIFKTHGLVIFDVEELATHGGSLRIYARHEGDDAKPVEGRVGELLGREIALGYGLIERYTTFRQQVEHTKRRLLEFLIDAKAAGRSVVGYGAPGKGNTLLNYCGIRTDFLDYTVDRNPYKQGKFTPGTHIPILAPERIDETKADYVLILPWNFKDEIMAQMAHIRRWGGQFVVAIPELAVYP
jgi:SAM-dependent methyltransferase